MNEHDDDIRWMAECAVVCDLCGIPLDRALHLCTGEGPPHYRSNCINLCESCVDRAHKTMVNGRVAALSDGA